ncbi:MAG TPA: SDR family NAD(P)-dependent oxidoreductase [Rhizomicrobium sp.]
MRQTRPRVLVTGGAAGIGFAIACAFRDAGSEVLIAGRDKGRLESTGFAHVVMDVCDADAVGAGLHRAGQIDILVANAGGADTAPALKTPPQTWDRMIALNLTSVVRCAQAVVPAMVERGWGRLIVLGSTASLKGYRYASAYAAAKHGVLGFVRSLALELAKTGVTANALCPGYTDTPMIAEAIDALAGRTRRTPEEAAAAFAAANPMGRLVLPEEVAAAALWLASDAAAAVNGQAIVIDGGETA